MNTGQLSTDIMKLCLLIGTRTELLP